MKLVKFSKIIFMMIIVAGLVGTFETHPAQAFSLVGKTEYKILHQAGAGISIAIEGNSLKGIVNPATGDKLAGRCRISVDGVTVATINEPPYYFSLDIEKEVYGVNSDPSDKRKTSSSDRPIHLNDGLRHTIEAVFDTFKPYSKDWNKRGKELKEWTAANTVSFQVTKVPVSETDQQIINRAQAEAGPQSSSGQGVNASDLANFFNQKQESPNTSTTDSSVGGIDTTDNGVGKITPALQNKSLTLRVTRGQQISVAFYDASENMQKIIAGSTHGQQVQLSDLAVGGQIKVTYRGYVIPVSYQYQKWVDLDAEISKMTSRSR